MGSAYELESQIILATDLNFMTEKDQEIVLNKLESIVKMMSKFMSTLK
jgi:four helix bundle protein